MPEQELGQPMAGAEEVRPHVFPAPQQVAGRLFLLGLDMNRREDAGPIEDGELAGVAPIGLDAIAGATRDQRGRDDVAGHGASREEPLQV